MALKIRCPHCQRVLLAEDWTAGEPKLCPACGKGFTVPLPSRIVDAGDTPRVEIAMHCGRCGGEIAPGTTFCKHCFTDHQTGKRLPLRRRLTMVSRRTWVLLSAGAATALIGASVGVHLYRLRQLAHTRPTQSRAVLAASVPAAEPAVAQRLMRANSRSERESAIAAIRQVGPDALRRLTEALAEKRDGPRTVQAARNIDAALELIAQSGDASLAPALRRLSESVVPASRVIATRAALGDAEVHAAVIDGWRSALRRTLFVQTVAALSAPDGRPSADAARRAAETDLARWTRGLRGLMRSADGALPPAVLDTYWESVGWLGQEQQDRIADALFDLAKPSGPDESVPERVRAARRSLEDAAQRGDPSTRAAAGMVLLQCAPQYESARRRVIAQLAGDLGSANGTHAQRAAWAMFRLVRREFEEGPEYAAPIAVKPEAVERLWSWCREQGIVNDASRPNLRLASAPQLAHRVVTPIRQLERRLVEEFRAGWPQAQAALERWELAGLGCTPRLAPLADPRQRQPNLPALAAALVLTGEYGDNDDLEMLELWTLAAEQPAWVRGLSAASGAAVVCRTHGSAADWLKRIERSAFDADPGPSWEHWGRVVAAGGPRMQESLRELRSPGLPGPVRERLLREAQKIIDRRR
ncbi:MAG: hypothetical protein HRF50_01365 [Phycisphaerae bacterium]|jgi:hypothetical protein